MARNTLFNFIKIYVINSKTASFPNCLGLIKDKNKEGHNYYRFDLQNNNVLFADEYHEYKLKGHHLSVYEIEKSNDPSLSQYHYTAYFYDNEGSTYQLHVYFDDKDNLTKNPVFSICSEDARTFTLIKREHLNDAFIELATSSITPTISNLRKQLSDKVQALEESYKALERRASDLSTTLDDNQVEYIQALNRTERTLMRLTPLVRHDHYAQIQVFIHRLQMSFAKHNPKESNSSEKSLSVALTPRDNPATTLSEHSLFKNKKRRTTAKPLPLNLEQELDILENSFSQWISATTYSVQTPIIADSYARLNELSLRLEDSQKTQLSTLKKLKGLHGKILKAGENLLRSLVKEGRYDLAEQLSAFHYLLTVQYLSTALQSRNHELLDFLLRNGNFTINNQPLTVKDKFYPSMVHYCCSQDSPKTPMVDNLSVLIKHGASLLAKDDKGLPLAHSILSSDITHPLWPAFTANKAQTIDSISFNKQLIADLDRYLRENKLNSEEIHLIENAKQNYSLAIQQSLMKAEYSSPTGKKLNEQIDIMKTKHGVLQKIMSAVRKDSEILEQIEILNRGSIAYMKRLPRYQRRNEANAKFDVFDKVDKLFESYDLDDLNFQSVRQNIIKFLKRAIKINQVKERLLDVQVALKKSYAGKPSTKRKQLAVEENTLIERIKNLQNKYSFLPSAEKQESLQFDTQLKNLNDSLKSLEALKEQLNSYSKIMNDLVEKYALLAVSNKAEDTEKADIKCNQEDEEADEVQDTGMTDIEHDKEDFDVEGSLVYLP